MNQRDRLLHTQRAENGARVVDLRPMDVEVAIEVEVDDAELVRASARKAIKDTLHPPLR